MKKFLEKRVLSGKIRVVLNERRRFLLGSAALGVVAGLPKTTFARGVAETTLPDPRAYGEMVSGLYLTDRLPGAVSLTFDDGPREDYTPRVLDILKAHDVTATFFVCGRRVAMRPGILERIVDEGHTIGNHTWSHPDLSSLGFRAIREQFDRTQGAIEKVLGASYPIVYYRPPYGSPWFSRSKYGERAVQRVCRIVDERQGMVILWQLKSSDTVPGNNRKTVIESVKSSLNSRPGGVLCMHDSNYHTMRALPEIISRIHDTDLDIVSLDEMVELKYRVPVDDAVHLPTMLRSSRG